FPTRRSSDLVLSDILLYLLSFHNISVHEFEHFLYIRSSGIYKQVAGIYINIANIIPGMTDPSVMAPTRSPGYTLLFLPTLKCILTISESLYYFCCCSSSPNTGRLRLFLAKLLKAP